MTTLIALATKHAVVVGADSLGTEVRRMVDPRQLIRYFDVENDFKLRTNTSGLPVLDDYWKVFQEAEQVPYNQLLHVNKLFRLGSLPIAAMFTGTISIGDHAVRGIVAEFVGKEPAVKAGGSQNYTVNSVTTRLLALLRSYYAQAYPEDYLEQDLELLVAGYDKNKQWPTILRVDVRANKIESAFAAGEFGIAFGGQMDWIQRIVFGADNRNRIKMAQRSDSLLELYRDKIIERVRAEGFQGDIPPAADFGDELSFFHEWELNGLRANWAEFSEQNAIDCVSFFLSIMIHAQDVSAELPTVGGNVHIAVIRKDGFYPVTKEVWTHEGYEVPVPEVGK